MLANNPMARILCPLVSHPMTGWTQHCMSLLQVWYTSDGAFSLLGTTPVGIFFGFISLAAACSCIADENNVTVYFRVRPDELRTNGEPVEAVLLDAAVHEVSISHSQLPVAIFTTSLPLSLNFECNTNLDSAIKVTFSVPPFRTSDFAFYKFCGECLSIHSWILPLSSYCWRCCLGFNSTGPWLAVLALHHGGTTW